MKSSLIIGVLCLIIGGAIAYLQHNGSNAIFTFPLVIGLLIGAGLGLILGAIGGYSGKSQSIKRKAMKQKLASQNNIEESKSSTIDNASTSDSSQN